VFIYRFLAAAVLAAAMSSLPSLPVAAQNPDYFIPAQPKPSPQRPATRTTPRPAAPAAPAPVAPAEPNLPPGMVAPPEAAEPPPEQVNVPLPPAPELPPLPPGAAPPAPMVGVIGVPDVMQASTAGQQVRNVVNQRRQKLNEDAQKEQLVWRDMQQALANDRAKLSAEQVRTRERELQERITNAQRQFRDRNRIIEEAARYALAQIERTLVAVIQQVAKARGMNLVLHRSQVALNVNDYDITEQVADQLNKVLPTVVIPPDGVSPVAMQQEEQKKAQAAPAPAPASAAKPATPPPAQGETPAAKPAN
jgi:Skp family chaperone for outer membrane proteins